jgi:invasion protein IalB
MNPALPLALVLLAVTAVPGIAGAQTPVPAAEAFADQKAPESNWVTQCGAKSRLGALDCSVQQTIIKTDTGQMVAQVSVRIPADTRAAVMMVHLPLGLFLPSGVQLQVDQNKVIDLPLQTCDANGCYAGTPVAADLLAEMQKGKSLRIGFKNLTQTSIDLPMPLSGFAAAYETIK